MGETATAKPDAAGKSVVLQPGLPEEDAGIEREPCETQRGCADAAEATVAARVRRNLLPCYGKIASGEVWGRTADWKGIFARRSAAGGAGRADDLKSMKLLFDSCAKLGLVHENEMV